VQNTTFYVFVFQKNKHNKGLPRLS